MDSQPVSSTSDLVSPVSLHSAASRGDLQTIERLIEEGADIEKKDFRGRTPLLQAAESGKTKAIRLLLDYEADTSATDNAGSTSLHYAVLRHQRINVALLLEYGAAINAQTKTGDTALCLAVCSGSFDIVRLLLDHDADLTIPNQSLHTPLHLSFNSTTVQPRIVSELLARGSDPNAKDKAGLTASDIGTFRAKKGYAISPESLDLLATDDQRRTETLTRSFFAAAEHGRTLEVSRLLDRGIDVNSSDASGQSALTLAAQGGHDVVKLLLEKGAKVDHQDECGHTALWWASFFGHEQATNYLLQHKAQVDLADETGFTPLSAAVRKKREEVTELLVCAWAQVDRKDETGKTPFLWAVAAGNLKIVELCLLEGNWGDSNDYDHFNKALETADDYGHVEIAELLIEHGAEDQEEPEDETAADATASQLETTHLNATNGPDQWTGTENNKDTGLNQDASVIKDIGPDSPGYRESALQIDWETDPSGLIHALTTSDLARVRRLLKAGVDPRSCRTKTGHTPLMEAAAGGHLELVENFLKHGVTLEARNIKGQTALWLAAQNGMTESIGLLLRNGADVEALSYANTSPLAAAAAWGCEGVVKMLVNRGAAIDSRDYKNQNALLHAARFGHDAIVQLLLENGADIEHTNKWGLTALHLAAVFDNRSTFRLLLNMGANFSAKMSQDFHCSDALSYAARNDHEVITELLIDAGADLNYRNDKGRTALLSTVVPGNSMIIKLLIENGANVKIKDNAGISPLCAAKMRFDLNRDEVIKVLSRATEIRKNAEMAKRDKSRKYKYHPITSKSGIRVLELQPGQDNEILRFDLFEVDLDDEPVFEALSYEWGERTGSIPVQCGDGHLLVTPNLKLVLRRLRRTDRARHVWIDALCINQEDIPERNQQVPLMTRIYRTASKVNMWLGDGNSYTKTGFSTISLLFGIYEAMAKLKPNFHNLTGKVKLDAATRSTILALWKDILSNEETVDGLRDLFRRGYFTRAWIFQEIILANDGAVMCGEYQCELTTWKKALHALDASELDFLKPAFPDKEVVIRKVLQVVEQTNRAVAYVNFLANLYHINTEDELFDSAGILITLANLQSGDPRDKVYAAVGLLKPPEQEALAPDYSLSTQEVYIMTARYMFTRKTPKIWAEWNRPHQKVVPNLPSWVPDWSAPAQDQGVQGRATPSLANLLSGDFETTPTTLYVNGFIVDKVAFVAPRSLANDVYDDIIKPMAIFLASRNISILGPHLQRPAVSEPVTNLSAIWDVLVRGKAYNSSSSDPKAREAISYLTWRVLTDGELGVALNLRSSISQDFASDFDSWTARSKSSATFDHEIYEWIDIATWRDNDIIITEMGDFGVSGGYKVAELGMLVAILGGIGHLCLLRKREENGEVWHEYVERALLRDVTEETLKHRKEELEGGKQRLEIR